MIEPLENIPDHPLSSLDCPLRFLARITLELETPLHIGTGQEWDESDAGVVLDANGLPTLPFTSITGILRHAFVGDAGNGSNKRKAANSLFGFQGKLENGDGTGQGSRLRGSFGCIHDASDTPVYGLIPQERFLLTEELAAKLPKKEVQDQVQEVPRKKGDPDPVLAAALRLVLRDHARHNESGVAADKFDELVVCAGHRFTFELELIGRSGDDERHWNELFALLANPLTRLGGKSRRGLGRFKVERVLRRRFNLKNGDFEDYANYDSRLDKPVPTEAILPGKWESFTPPATDLPTIIVTLKPRFFWMFGTGQDPDGDSDHVPIRDWRVVWTKDVPEVKEVLYLPGSGLKGGLRHRAWFHAHAKFQHFADKPNPPGRDKAHKLVVALFGNEPNVRKERKLQPGILHPDDQFEKVEATEAPLQNHVSIDRFTGGARDSLLFDEKPLWRSGTDARVKPDGQPGLRFSIQLARKLTSDEAEVLERCLNDLTQSRLSIGGGSGRGHGFCDGNFVGKAAGCKESTGLSAVTESTTTKEP